MNKKAFQSSVKKLHTRLKISEKKQRRRWRGEKHTKTRRGILRRVKRCYVIMQNNRRRHDGMMIEMMILFSQWLFYEDTWATMTKDWNSKIVLGSHTSFSLVGLNVNVEKLLKPRKASRNFSINECRESLYTLQNSWNYPSNLMMDKFSCSFHSTRTIVQHFIFESLKKTYQIRNLYSIYETCVYLQ